ncbi:hypothetical protein K9N50_05670 [bacterium]|nr:hypothetical protein [bacterium]
MTWLFLSIIITTSRSEYKGSDVTGLNKTNVLECNIEPATPGIALTKSAGGTIYALYDAPLRIIVWQSGKTKSQEFSNPQGISAAPSDLAPDGGLGLFMVDPWNDHIFHLDRRLQQMPSIIPKLNNERFEPLSICRSMDGNLFVLNRADDDLWKIDRDGIVVKYNWSPSGSGKLTNPRRIRYNSQIDKLVILNKDYLLLSNPNGSNSRKIPLRLKAASGIAVSDREIWIAGDYLECIPLKTKTGSFLLPSDSLRAWNAFPAIDVTYDNNDFLYVLSGFDGNVLKLKIQRASTERP